MEQMKKEILMGMANVLKQNGFPTQFFEGENGNPPVTQVELRRQGKVQQDVMMQLSFIPMGMAREETTLFQFYATLLVNMPEKSMPELKRAIFYLNDYCPIGQFGLFESNGEVYMRHNLVLEMDKTLEEVITYLCDYFSLMLASIGKFMDGLAQIASGAATIEVARDMELIP